MAGKPQGLALGLAALVLGMAGGSLAAYLMLKTPLARLNLTTPVFVLDRARLIQSLPPDASQEQMSQTVEAWTTLGRKLSAAGYLVIDSTAVVAAPADVYVRPEGH
ncbi:MAG: hypothetical protein WAW36_01865 [Methylovulum miyakonense]|uniref:hypothetical protein n=1 Tax=Methylovulum miyakonense TaxID=645578 RepID=UPI003BB72B1E